MLFHVKKTTKVAFFSDIHYQTKFHDPAISGTSVAPTSEISTAK